MQKVIALLNINNCLRPKSRKSIEAAADRWGAEIVEVSQPIATGRHHFWQKALVHTAVPDDCHVLQLDTDILIRRDAPSPFPLIAPQAFGLTRVNPNYCRWVGGRYQTILFWAKTLDLPPLNPFCEYPNLGFMMYSTAPEHGHRDLLAQVYQTGELVDWCKDHMPEQTVLAYLLKHQERLRPQRAARIPLVWMPTVYNTCGPHKHTQISLSGKMTTFIYHFCGDSKWVMPKMDWTLPAAQHIRANVLAHLLGAAGYRQDQQIRGLELGVNMGAMASRLFCFFPQLHLTMVDPWIHHGPDSRYRQSGDAVSKRTQRQHDQAFEIAWRETEFAIDRRRLIYQTSEIAADKVADESLDLIFIDADHSYEAVREDISLWLQKLRPGGVLAGHDYHGWGVKQAVDEFALQHGVEIDTHPDSVWACRPFGAKVTA